MKKGYFLAIVLAQILFSMPSSVYASIVINEFLPNTVDNDYEWIEIYNDGGSIVNLSQYNISEESASKNFTIENLVLEPNSFLVLVRNDEIFNQTYSQNGLQILEYGNVVASLKLNNGDDSIFLYDSNGNLIDSIIKYSDPGKNVSIGRYPDGNSGTVKLLAQTPGTKNDNSNPSVEWIYPKNGTYVDYLVNIVVKIIDDASSIGSAMINFDGTDYPMSSNNGQWSYLWNTSASIPKSYNMTVFFEDSSGNHYSDTIFNIAVNNTEVINQLNNVPVIILVNLTNTDYLKRANGSLKLSWLYKDDDNDAIADKEILWYLDGNEQSALRNLDIISSSYLAKSQAWIAGVRAFDGKNWSAFYNSSSLRIDNSAPNLSIPLITSSDSKGRKNSTLSCSSDLSDLDKDNASKQIRWYKNNVVILSAAGSLTLRQGNFSKNDVLICEATPVDNMVNGTSLNSTGFKIMNSAPSLVSGIQNRTLSQGSAITINLIGAFIDIDGDPLTYSSSPIDGINISIDNNKKIAAVIPDGSFSGTRSIIFTASDGTDTASSNEVFLIFSQLATEDSNLNDETAESQQLLEEGLQDSKEPDLESNESLVITGEAISTEAEAKSKKTGFIYIIVSFLVVVAGGIFFVYRKLLNKEQL